MADPTTVLARRYRRLLLAYPGDYRAERGDEIVGTLLDLAHPGRRRPTLAEAADLFGNGLRRRFGTASVAGFEAGLALAAPFALAIAAGISAYAWWRVEPLSAGGYTGGPTLFGLFRTLGPFAYAAWLLAALARSLLRPPLGRAAIAGAIAVTLLLPVVAAWTPIDRPPLWVLMALAVFGAVGLAGTSVALGAHAPSADERLAIPAGALAVAVTASTVVLVWPPTGGGFGYYYQPTLARVGAVVAATVATVAVTAIIRVVRRRPARDWLWATALLGLPAGWLGPFDSAGLRVAADQEVPHFGRLAQVLLATCLAVVTMVWLVRRPIGTSSGRPAAAPPGPAGARGPAGTPVSVESSRARRVPRGGLAGLATAGAATLGSLLGLVAFAAIGGLGLAGFLGQPLRDGVPGHVAAAGVALLLAGGFAVIAARPRRPRPAPFLVGMGVAFVAAWLVASYDNGWTTRDWPQFGHTAALVATLALLPLAICAVVAIGAGPWRGGAPVARAVVLGVALGWLGYATVPYVFSWGPVLLVLIACCAVLALTGRRPSATS